MIKNITEKIPTGDEILAVNGSVLHGLSHSEAIFIFKKIRVGPVVIQVQNTAVSRYF